MKIDVRKIVRPIRLAEYAEEYGDEAIWVWVNPPRQVRLDYWAISQEFAQYVDERLAAVQAVVQKAEAAGVKDAAERTLDELEPDGETREALAALDRKLEELSRRLYGWFANVWSQTDDEEEHWTTDLVVEFVEACMDADPRFWSWVQEEHWRLINEHRDGAKKK